MKKLLFIVMILTLSSCMVSKKLYDKKCCEVDELKAQMKSDKAVYDYQDELCRRVAYELQLQLDTCKAKKDTLTDEEIKKLF
jgi:hypothetical protein